MPHKRALEDGVITVNIANRWVKNQDKALLMQPIIFYVLKKNILFL